MIPEDDIGGLLLAMDLEHPAPAVTSAQSVLAVVNLLSLHEVEEVVVVDEQDRERPIATVTRSDVVDVYNRAVASADETFLAGGRTRRRRPGVRGPDRGRRHPAGAAAQGRALLECAPEADSGLGEPGMHRIALTIPDGTRSRAATRPRPSTGSRGGVMLVEWRRWRQCRGCAAVRPLVGRLVHGSPRERSRNRVAGAGRGA